MTLDLRTMFQTWVKVLIRPSEQVFEAERRNPVATLHTALVWVFLTAVVTTILDFLHTQFMPSSLEGHRSATELRTNWTSPSLRTNAS